MSELWLLDMKTKHLNLDSEYCLWLIRFFFFFSSRSDPTDSSSFQRAQFWVKQLQDYDETVNTSFIPSTV